MLSYYFYYHESTFTHLPRDVYNATSFLVNNDEELPFFQFISPLNSKYVILPNHGGINEL